MPAAALRTPATTRPPPTAAPRTPAGRAPHPIRLVTPRLVLRPATPADLPALASVFASNPAFLRTMGTGLRSFDLADADRYLAAETGRANGQCLALVERATGAVVGSAALVVPNPSDGVPWVGLLIIRADRQNRGLGRETATAVERTLARDGWPEVRLAVLASNPRARRFWERLGYRELDGCWRAYNGRARAGVTLAKALASARAGAGSTDRPGASHRGRQVSSRRGALVR